MCGNPKNIHICPHTIHTCSHTYTVPLLSVSGRSPLTWLRGGSTNAQAQKTSIHTQSSSLRPLVQSFCSIPHSPFRPLCILKIQTCSSFYFTIHRPNSTKCQLHGKWNFSLAVHIPNSNLLYSITLKKKKNQIHLQKKPNSTEQTNKKNPCYFHQQLHRTNGERGQCFSSLRDIWCGSTSEAERSISGALEKGQRFCI